MIDFPIVWYRTYEMPAAISGYDVVRMPRIDAGSELANESSSIGVAAP